MKRNSVKTGMRVQVSAEGSLYHGIKGVVTDVITDKWWNGSRNIQVTLEKFGNRFFSPEYLQLRDGELPAEPQITFAMIVEHFEGFLDHCKDSHEDCDDDEYYVMAREAVASAKVALKAQEA